MARHHLTALLASLLLVPLVAACSGDEPADLPPTVPPSSSAAASPSPAAPSAYPTSVPDVSVARTVASRLDVPWGVAFLPDRSALVAQRDGGEVVRVTEEGDTSPVGTVAGVVHRGEGGLLGLAIPPADLTGGRLTVFAYFTTDRDNRIAAMPYVNGRLGRPTTVVTGIPAAGNHDGGRMIVGPDGKLWVGTGESGDKPLSQD